MTGRAPVFASVNPATGQVMATYRQTSELEIDHLLEGSWQAFSTWRTTGPEVRSALLSRLAAALEQSRDDLGREAVISMGKPIVEARAEIDKCIWLCHEFAERGAGYLATRYIDATQSRYVRYDPLGPMLAIMPWNFPFWQVFRQVVPALIVGNSTILKHSPNVINVGIALERLFERVEAPPGLFTHLIVDTKQVPRLIGDWRVRGVSVTGSVDAGRSVAASASTHLKPTVLELGGSDAFIVLEDGNIELAAQAGALSRTQNAGQSCIAAKRFLVHRDILDPFTESLAAKVASRRVGDPQLDSTEVGPLARQDLRDRLDYQVRATVAEGATVAVGCHGIGDRGFYYSPGVLTGVQPNYLAAREELFGPVAAVTAVDSQAHAVALANASAYGLGASIWTDDLDRAQQVASDLEVGVVAINEMVQSDPRLPFGGVKNSGWGRELGEHGIHQLANIKAVTLNL